MEHNIESDTDSDVVANGTYAYFKNYMKQLNEINPHRKDYPLNDEYNFTNHLCFPKNSLPPNVKFVRIDIFTNISNKQQIVRDVRTHYSKKNGDFIIRYKFEDTSYYKKYEKESYNLITYFTYTFGDAEYELRHESCFPCTFESAISEDESDSN